MSAALNAIPDRQVSTPEEIAANGVDAWDVAAHLEASGVSRSVAREHGYDTVFEYAQALLAQSLPDGRDSAPFRRPSRLLAAFWRAVVMLGVVLICVSTMPSGVPETVVFAIAAAGWFSGQIVSASLWYAWGRNDVVGTHRAALLVGGLVVLAGAVGSLVLRQAELLVWVVWGVCAATLVILRPGWRLALGVAGAAVACWATMLTLGKAATMVVALIAAALALVAVVATLWQTLRHERGLPPARTARSVAIAVGQTAGQVFLLWLIFVLVGPQQFGALAVAGLVAGVLADPVFELAQALVHRVVQRNTSWLGGRLLVGSVGIVTVLAFAAIAVATAHHMLQDPYIIFADDQVVTVAAVLIGSLTAAINILLRTGMAFGAFLAAAFAALMTVGASSVIAWDYAWSLVSYLAISAVMAVVAAWVAASRMAHPSTW